MGKLEQNLTEYVEVVVPPSSPMPDLAQSLMLFGVSLILLAIMTYIAMMVRFDRLSKSGGIGPNPNGFDPERETRREFIIRTWSGFFGGILTFGVIVLFISTVIRFSGMIG